jgi:hypothetical protein
MMHLRSVHCENILHNDNSVEIKIKTNDENELMWDESMRMVVELEAKLTDATENWCKQK